MTLEEMFRAVDDGTIEGTKTNYEMGEVYGRFNERLEALAFIREQATKGTADYEHKLMKLADAIERGEHEG